MYLSYTKEQMDLRDELRAYFAQLITPDVAALSFVTSRR